MAIDWGSILRSGLGGLAEQFGGQDLSGLYRPRPRARVRQYNPETQTLGPAQPYKPDTFGGGEPAEQPSLLSRGMVRRKRFGPAAPMGEEGY